MKINIFHTRRLRLLRKISKQSSKSLTKINNYEYTPVPLYEIINLFKNMELIETFKIGREIHCNLTDKGKEVLILLNKVNKYIK